MTLIDRLGAGLPRAPVTVELDDIQATVLRCRPEPYYGTHVMLHVADARAGREFLRRLTPHVDSAADWWRAGQSWISVAISYAGLVALGVPEDSLRSFPEAFRAGMAARAGQLLDYGENEPQHWDAPFGGGLIHLGVSVFSDSESAWRRTMGMARQQYQGFPGLTVLMTQDFGAQPGGLNPLGYKDSIGQPAVEGSGVDSLPGQGPPVKASEFILGYPGQAGVPLPMPQPHVLGRNGTFAGLHEHAQTEQERELLAAKLIGRWRSGAPELAQRVAQLAAGTDAQLWYKSCAGAVRPCPRTGTAGRRSRHWYDRRGPAGKPSVAAGSPATSGNGSSNRASPASAAPSGATGRSSRPDR